MALALTNPVVSASGSDFVLSGTWTASGGDAAGTVALGRPAKSAEFFPNLTSGPTSAQVLVSGLGSTTLTVYHQEAVTDGRFRITY